MALAAIRNLNGDEIRSTNGLIRATHQSELHLDRHEQR